MDVRLRQTACRQLRTIACAVSPLCALPRRHWLAPTPRPRFWRSGDCLVLPNCPPATSWTPSCRQFASFHAAKAAHRELLQVMRARRDPRGGRRQQRRAARAETARIRAPDAVGASGCQGAHQAPANGYSAPQGRFRLTYRWTGPRAGRYGSQPCVRPVRSQPMDRSGLSGPNLSGRAGQVRAVQDGTGQRGAAQGYRAKCRAVAKHL